MTKEERKEYNKKYREDNKDKISENRANYRSKNKERQAIAGKKWYEEHKKMQQERHKQYYIKNKKRIIEYNNKNKPTLNRTKRIYVKNKMISNKDFSIKMFLRYGFRRLTKGNCGWRGFFNISGYSREDYVLYFSENYETEFELYRNTREYHIDHIIPVSAYDFTIIEDIKNCWNPRNLRIIPAKENIGKGANIDMDLIKRYGITDLMPKGWNANG